MEGGWCWPGRGLGGVEPSLERPSVPFPPPPTCHLLRKRLSPCCASRSGALSPWAHNQVGETLGDRGCAGARWGYEGPEEEPRDPCCPGPRQPWVGSE